MAQKKQWLDEIKLVRGISILAVLLIHVSGRPLRVLSTDSTSYAGYLILNTLLQYAVPSFVLISTLVLTYGFQAGKQIDWKEFYRKRIRQVIIPYLGWTAIYLLYRYYEQGSLDITSMISWRNWLLFGKGYFHLYYLSVVIQLYFFYPLILKLFKLRSWSFAGWLLLAVALQLGFYWINRWYIYSRLPFPASFLYWYIPLVFVGIWLGANLQDWYSRWRQFRLPVIIATVAGGYLYLQQTFFLMVEKGSINTFTYQIWWYLYVTGLSLLVIRLGLTVKNNWPGGKRLLSSLGHHSFGIYVVHIIFLNYWNSHIQTGNPLLFHLYFILGFMVVLMLSWLFTAAVAATPLAVPLLGGKRKKSVTLTSADKNTPLSHL